MCSIPILVVSVPGSGLRSVPAVPPRVRLKYKYILTSYFIVEDSYINNSKAYLNLFVRGEPFFPFVST
jgi:hypothetical protein